MVKLIKYELKKTRSFRITGVLLGLVLAIISTRLFKVDTNWATVIISLFITLMIGLFALMGVGSLYQLKADLNKPSPLVFTSPYSGVKIARAKILSVFINILVITFVTVFLALAFNKFDKFYGIEDIFGTSLQRSPEFMTREGTIYGLITNLAQSIDLINWISIVFLSMTLVRSKYKEIGLFKWAILALVIYVGSHFLVHLANEFIPLLFDPNKAGFYLADLINYDPFSYGINIGYKLLYFFPKAYDDPTLILPAILVVPNILIIGLTIVNVRVSGYLIDRKIDF